MRNYLVLFIFLIPLTVAPAFAQSEEKWKVVEVGLEEQTGSFLPENLEFVDEQGTTTTLRKLVDKPTILCLVYFTCPSICSPLLQGVGEVIDTMELKPGIDYQVLTISFDPDDKPDLALAKKTNYLETLKRQIPQRSWRFLTGTQANISAITDAVGFRYVEEGDEYNHPGLITILSESAQVSRYVRGISFVPADVEMALVEAAQGRVGSPRLEATKANRLLAFCFVYDPASNSYVPNIMRIVGLFTIVMVAFFISLVVLIKKPKKEVSP